MLFVSICHDSEKEVKTVKKEFQVTNSIKTY